MNETHDQMGSIKLVQSPSGVKASVDGVLLARFVRPGAHWNVADLGCGNGLVGLLMARDQPQARFLGVEIQDVLIRQALAGSRASGLTNIRFVRADLQAPPWSRRLERFDLVVANPPYRKVGTGRLSPDPVRAAARHEILADAGVFARAAASLLRDGSSSAWIYLAERHEALRDAVRQAGMEPVRFRYVKSRGDLAPVLVLLEAVKGGDVGMLLEEEPLVLYEGKKGRQYTEEAREMIYGVEP
ncbi:MAG: methyltransferase domain-containing protein [bacterium]|nr:MAG: methyltransferase domain-containing protein [bacterium]